jgi:hypothetical protein
MQSSVFDEERCNLSLLPSVKFERFEQSVSVYKWMEDWGDEVDGRSSFRIIWWENDIELQHPPFIRTWLINKSAIGQMLIMG